MKRLSNILILSVLALFANAQTKTDIMYIKLTNGDVVTYSVDEIENISFEAPAAEEEEEIPSFPKDDGAKKLNLATLAQNAADLLIAAGVECTDTMGRIKITDAEYQEIKTFTDELVKYCKTQKEIYDVCFKYVYNNTKYGHEYEDGSIVNNDPYPVFTKKYAVCQGYSNLLFVMLHSQNVPVLITNGFLNGYGAFGGHAWNYVNCDDTWYVSDPTNNMQFEMSNISSYSHLTPYSFDVVLFEQEDCLLDYYEKRLNICTVTTDSKYFVTPFSAGGYQVSSFNPTSDISPTVREIYIGKNIDNLGEEIVGLNIYAPNVEYAHVDPQNTEMCSYAGVVYLGWAPVPLYIPAAMKRIELMPMETMYKNTIYNHNGVEELVIAKGTKCIEDWAVENCPNLKKAYVPKDAAVCEKAFYGVHTDFEIIYTD